MYTIELDTDPVELGFDPKEVTKNADGTFTVTRRFVHAQHYHSADYNYSIEAYCPCLTDNVEIYCYVVADHRGRTTYGISYVTNDNPKQNNEGRSLNNTRIDYMHPIGPGMFNRMYDAHIEDRAQETAASFCVAAVNDHPNNISSSRQQDYFKEHRIVFGKSAPTAPYSDPFLPEKFKKMLGNA